jgi:hypothetical protein
MIIGNILKCDEVNYTQVMERSLLEQSPLHLPQADKISPPTFPYIPFQLCIHSIHMNFNSNNYVITFTGDNCFGLDVTRYKELDI